MYLSAPSQASCQNSRARRGTAVQSGQPGAAIRCRRFQAARGRGRSGPAEGASKCTPIRTLYAYLPAIFSDNYFRTVDQFANRGDCEPVHEMYVLKVTATLPHWFADWLSGGFEILPRMQRMAG